jgi:hypothetical protein
MKLHDEISIREGKIAIIAEYSVKSQITQE